MDFGVVKGWVVQILPNGRYTLRFHLFLLSYPLVRAYGFVFWILLCFFLEETLIFIAFLYLTLSTWIVAFLVVLFSMVYLAASGGLVFLLSMLHLVFNIRLRQWVYLVMYHFSSLAVCITSLIDEKCIK